MSNAPLVLNQSYETVQLPIVHSLSHRSIGYGFFEKTHSRIRSYPVLGTSGKVPFLPYLRK